uniref:Uncharacterized protein n=1 Tax=Monopterus albus TaxID=43700 RepID=A0A3Q3QQ50_MONAL
MTARPFIFCSPSCSLFLFCLSLFVGQISGCSQGQWQCGDGSCIPDLWRCDGSGDCLDGSDEMDCAVLNACFAKLLTFHFLSWCLVSSYPALPGSPKCPPGQFPCLDSVGCVDVSARCDGQSQCPTGSDEENCTATKGCLDSDWSCRNYICIPKELRCSGLNDCMDNSDEEGCGEKEDFKCKDHRSCISRNLVCDGHAHCQDGSDEVDCSLVASPAIRLNILRCRRGFELCADGTECILSSHVCDGEQDCQDGSDELECDDFLCKDRRGCISKSLVCDGRAHCLDGSDEVNCPSVSITTSQPNALKCRIGSKLCNDGRECVLHSHICDGEADCVDGSDEQGCPEACSQGYFAVNS